MQSEGSSYKVTILKNSEKSIGLHLLQSGIRNERVKLVVVRLLWTLHSIPYEYCDAYTLPHCYVIHTLISFFLILSMH